MLRLQLGLWLTLSGGGSFSGGQAGHGLRCGCWCRHGGQ